MLEEREQLKLDEALRLVNTFFTHLNLGYNRPISQYCMYALMDVNGLVFGEQKKNMLYFSLIEDHGTENFALHLKS
jgi:hypothetical protein